MLISAIVVVGEPPAGGEAGDECLPAGGVSPMRSPLACVEILGQSALERTVQRLHRSAGVKSISVLTPDGIAPVAPKRPSFRGCRVIQQPVDGRQFSEVLQEQAQAGADAVLFIRLGAYVEFDFADLAQFHGGSGRAVTQVHDAKGPVDVWIINVHPARCDSYGINFGGRVLAGANSGAPYLCNGYVNRLTTAADLRGLVVDSLLGRCSIQPAGREVKPGIWMDDSASVHRTARIVAPAYVGSAAKVGASALVTRCSNIEHHSEIGAGTAVNNSTILPYTRIGKALRVTASVVEGNRLTHLGHNISIDIEDPHFLQATAVLRAQEGRQTSVGLGSLPATSSLNFSEGD